MIDSCVFARRAWTDPILDSARAGYLVPIWSPCIIAETNRLLTWLWLKRHRGELTDATWRRLSSDAHRWFDLMAEVFYVVEDRPPPEPMWTAAPPDPYDAPVWSAAVRASAHFVVTENLRDGPPPNAHGIRVHANIVYVHPTHFGQLLDYWSNLVETGDLPVESRHTPPASAAPPGAIGDTVRLPPAVERLLRSLEQQS